MNYIANKILNIALPFVILFSFISKSSGQILKDTLQEIKIRDKKNISTDDRLNTFSPGQKIITIDSAVLQQYQMQNVASLLAQQTPVFIKSYGLNGLATLNFRGSSAAQSQVFWNGIPIQNAALGIADISLLPVSMIHKMHIVYGSSSALWGSGNVGGALVLESESPAFGKKKLHYEIAAGAGSFNQYQLSAKFDINSKKWSFDTRVFYQTAENNFLYKDDFAKKIKTENAHLEGLAILPQIAYKPDGKNVFRLAAWYQKYYREIPAALFESYSVKNRNDESLRLLFDWDRKAISSALYIRSAFITEKMNYDDEAVLQHFKNTSYQYFIETGWKKKIRQRHQLLIFAPVQLSWMQQSNSTKQQSKYAIAAAYSYSDMKKKLLASVNLRGEMINEQTAFLPGINLSYAINGNFLLRTNIQKTYRAASLNELYYEPGGNKNLKPEQGWAEEIGYKATTKILKTISFVHDVSVFNRNINDWILWLGGAIWTPHNIASVHSRGIETENLFSFPINKKISMHAGFNASYILATTISSYLPNDGSIGKQIPYTPKYSGLMNIGFIFQSFYFNYNYTYTGYRFVNIDETDRIASYSISNVQLSYDLKIRNKTIGFNVQVNNLLNTSYQVVKARPMPGINWLLGVRLSSL